MKLERGNRTFCWFLIRLLGLLPVIGVLVFTLIKFLPRIEAASYDIQVTLTASCNLYTSGGSYATLIVTEPTGEECRYWNDTTSIGGWMSLSADYERYRLADPMNGYYYIEVEMNELDPDAYCQVLVTLYEGASYETVIVYGPFRMYMQKLQVGCFKMPEAIEIPWGNIVIDETDCFIATAAYGTEMASGTRILLKFRDKYLIKSEIGERLIKIYYKVSPPIARIIAKNPMFRKVVRAHLKPYIVLAEEMVD